MAVKVPSKQSKQKPSDDDVEVVEVEETATSEPSEEQTELVQFALTQDISPAPRCGNIDLVRDYGMPELKKGIVKIPRLVGEVLADKGYGQIVS